MISLAVNFKSSICSPGLRSTRNLDIFDRSRSLLLIPINAMLLVFDLPKLLFFFELFMVNYKGSWMALRGLSGDFYASPISSKINTGIVLFLIFFSCLSQFWSMSLNFFSTLTEVQLSEPWKKYENMRGKLEIHWSVFFVF